MADLFLKEQPEAAGDYFSEEEKKRLLEVYRRLKSCGHLEYNYKAYRSLLTELLLKGCWSRDEFGYNGLLRHLETALIAVEELGLSSISVSAILFYRAVLKEFYSLQEVECFTSKSTADLIAKMLQTEKIYMRRAFLEGELFRELLLSVAEDARVLLLIIADRLYRMRTAKDYLPLEKRKEQALEVGTYFLPLIHKLGLYAIKGELEDLYLKYTDPDAFYWIKNKLGETKKNREKYLNNFLSLLKKRLDAGRASRWKYTIKARTKSIYSIHNKIKTKGVDFDGIFDLTAIRIILNVPLKHELEACWYIYSLVTDAFEPDIKRLRDWITHPKDNGYESLQITVKGPEERFVEVQIRTARMDEIAERGVAAHWRYKGLKSEGQFDSSLTSVRKFLEKSPNESRISDEKYRIKATECIFVFTPLGELKKLPAQATVLDFAFSIHGNVGSRAVSAIVNGRNVSLRTQLHNGDTVNIITSKNQYPREDWLQFVVSSSAKAHIRRKIREQKEKGLATAREMLDRRFRNRKLIYNERIFLQLIYRWKYASSKEFFIDLGEGKIDIATFLSEYEKEYELQHSALESQEEQRLDAPLTYEEVKTGDDVNKDNTITGKGDGSVVIVDTNIKGLDYILAKCCNPQYGDSIVAYPTRNGIRIHRCSCPNMPNLIENNPEKILPAQWNGLGGNPTKAHIHIEGINSMELVSRIISLFNHSVGIRLLSYNIKPNEALMYGEFTVQALRPHLNALRNRLNALSGIHSTRIA